MPRLPSVDPETAPDSVRELLASTPLSLFGMVAHAESAFDPWLRYGGALLLRLTRASRPADVLTRAQRTRSAAQREQLVADRRERRAVASRARENQRALDRRQH
jgi:hypothetical protein